MTKDLTFHELLELGKIAKAKPIDRYIEVDKRPYAQLPRKEEVKKAIRRIVDDKAKRREIMDKRLLSWGQWAEAGKSSNYATTSPLSDNDGDYEGYDHCLLSDFDSLMIQVDQAVMNLNPIDSTLITYEYKCLYENGAKRWETKYEKTPGRYRRRKSELLLYLSYKITPKRSDEK